MCPLGYFLPLLQFPTYCKTHLFGGNLILAILVIMTKSAKIYISANICFEINLHKDQQGLESQGVSDKYNLFSIPF